MKIRITQVREGHTITWGKMPTRVVEAIEHVSHGRILHFADGTHDFLGNASKVELVASAEKDFSYACRYCTYRSVGLSAMTAHLSAEHPDKTTLKVPPAVAEAMEDGPTIVASSAHDTVVTSGDGRGREMGPMLHTPKTPQPGFCTHTIYGHITRGAGGMAGIVSDRLCSRRAKFYDAAYPFKFACTVHAKYLVDPVPLLREI